jgi:hypothetical protein
VLKLVSLKELAWIFGPVLMSVMTGRAGIPYEDGAG